MKAIVKKSGKYTLREIEMAVIEKLSNKIMRQFTFDLTLMLLPILLIMLEWRQST
jgi:hypothetical protein